MQIEVEGKVIDVPVKSFSTIIVAAVLVLSAFTLFYQVAPEEDGLVLRFGRHIKTAEPGLHFKLPFGIDRVIKVPTRILAVESFGYRDNRLGTPMSAYRDENSMLTGDLNMVLVGWDVQFSRVNSKDFVFNVQDPINTLRDISQSVMREVTGDRASILILTVGRSEIQQLVRERLQRQCDQFRMGIHINEVNLLFVDPPGAVVEAFNDLNKAEQDAVRFFEEASKLYQERVPRARGEAQRVILEAEGFRQRRINTARGEASRFVDMMTAYQQSPDVTRTRLYLETMERQLPGVKEVIVVDENLQGLLPLMNVRGGAL